MTSKRQIADDYDRFWKEGLTPSDDWTRLGKRPLRMQALRVLPRSPGRILDIGCGNGLALAALRQRSIQAIGCDISTRALHDARAQGVVVRADASLLPFRSATLDTLLVLDALEHVIEKAALVRECHRVLTPRGQMLVTTPLPKATGGRGDDRQPYDRPATLPEILDMTSGLFRLRGARGVGWTPRGLGRLAWVIPTQVYPSLPFILKRSTEVLLVFEKG